MAEKSATENVQLAPIPLSRIRLDGGTQPRVAIAEDVVKEYAEALLSGVTFPPPDVFYDGADYWLGDGFHRYHAAVAAGAEVLTCAMRFGTRRDAVLFSVGANRTHGMRRSNDDKRKAVLTLLNDEEWGQWSNAEIARKCGVDTSTVDKWRSRSLPDSGSEKPRSYTSKHGTKATMNVSNIGGKSEKTKDAIDKRHEQIRTMASDGHSSQQIAAVTGLNENTVRRKARDLGIDLTADRVKGRTRRIESNRIVEQIVSDAENLLEGIQLITFSDLDVKRVPGWVESLVTAKRGLGQFISRLTKESKSNGEAA